MPWQATIEFPVLPHEKQPDGRPYPDYFTEALKLTRLVSDDRFKTVRLRTRQGTESRYLVLPVQTEAFGFTAAFRALLAAHLDHELDARGIDANRQADVVDAYGPFVRRFDEATVADLAKQHPSSALLAPYVGHDGADKAFMTLVLKEGNQTRIARRDLALPAGSREAAAAMAALLPALLGELRVGLAPAPAKAGAGEFGCRNEAWQLNPPDAGDAAARACHAVILGTLMPEFDERRSHFPNTNTPAKLAWLATAFVEASAHPAAAAPAAMAVQEMAWSQLQLDETRFNALEAAQSADPVVGRLARLLSAQDRSSTSPARSVREATERHVEEAARDLPAFVQAVFIERGNYGQAFRQVDVCAIELQLPGMMPSAKCRDSWDPSAQAAPAGPAGPGQVALYQEWRLAAFQKDLRYFGHTLGQRERLAQLLASLPGDVARHPFIRQQRFLLETFDSPLEGGFDAHLARVRDAASSFVQATADLQRYDLALAGHSLSEHAWIQNTNVLNDKTISQLSDDELRLVTVLRFDRFVSTQFPATRRAAGTPAAFLANGSMRMAGMQAMMQAASASASPGRGPAGQLPALPPMSPASAPPRRLFAGPGLGEEPPKSEAQWQAQIAQRPNDMESRVALAMQMLKQGKPASEARRVIDDYPPNMRVDQQVGQSHVWALPAHAFFFASDLDNAKPYYQRVLDIGTGSGSDLHARARMRQIDGDFQGVLATTADRLRRYENDFTRRDLAGLLFMTGQNEPAWQVVTPRLAAASTFQLWVGALVGQRVEHRNLKSVKEWVGRQGLDSAQIRYQDTAPMYLHLYGVVDRAPTDGDVALLRGTGPSTDRNGRWVASAQLVQMALQGTTTNFESVRNLLAARWDPRGNHFMRPLFTWVAWHATAGKDPELEAIRQTDLATGDFDSLLAKSMLLALEGQTDASLEFLRAARYQMSELGLASPNVDRPIPSPYEYALAGYLMFGKTGKEAYRTETLRFAQAHQKIFPFWGWSYALEALLERNDKNRAEAICRAKYLDAASYFLSLVKPVAAERRVACRKTPWAAPG